MRLQLVNFCWSVHWLLVAPVYCSRVSGISGLSLCGTWLYHEHTCSAELSSSVPVFFSFYVYPHSSQIHTSTSLSIYVICSKTEPHIGMGIEKILLIQCHHRFPYWFLSNFLCGKKVDLHCFSLSAQLFYSLWVWTRCRNRVEKKELMGDSSWL